MSRFHKKRNIPIILVMIIWLIDVLIWTPLWLNYIDKQLGAWFLQFQPHWWSGLETFFGTNLSEIFLPICLYIFVARTYLSNRIIDTRSPNRYQRWVLCILILGTYFLFVPQVTYEYDISTHLILAFTFMGVGWCEEYAYRGVISRVFKDRFGMISAIVLVAMLFAASHWVDIIVQFNQQIFSINWTLDIANTLLFGLVFGIIVWRSGSILWAAYMHFMNDWHPWSYGNPNWMTGFHIPLLGNNIGIFVIGLVGAEMLRFFTARTPQVVAEPNHFRSIDAHDH